MKEDTINLSKACLAIFTSRVKVKILYLFLANPRNEFHMREVARIVNEQINAVRRILNKLEFIGFLNVKTDGIKKVYSLNENGIFINELRSLLLKSHGLGNLIFLHKKDLGDVQFAILTHTYLNREESSQDNPDLLIIGNPNVSVLLQIIREAQEIEKKKIHYRIISIHQLNEYKRRPNNYDIVLYSAMVLPRAFLIGKDEEFVV